MKLEQFKCVECGKTYKTQSNLNKHIKLVHECRKDHICTECGNAFAQKSHLDQHISAKHSKVIKCHYCNNEFHTYSDREAHVTIEHEERPYKCHYIGTISH